jgi:phosphoribosylglycinamide formyltransferase-1
MNLAVLASGEGTNFQAIAGAARRGRLGPVRLRLLISDHPRARALERAATLGVATHLIVPAKHPARDAFDQALVRALQEADIGLVALAGYMRILSPAIVRAYRGRLVNIHPALLPAFPGAHAIRDALRHGVRLSGVTVHFVDEGVDTGPIIAQEAVPVLPDDTEATLAARIHAVEHRLYPEVIRGIAEGAVRLEGRRVVVTGAAGSVAATGRR